jgi:hypothetical protein
MNLSTGPTFRNSPFRERRHRDRCLPFCTKHRPGGDWNRAFFTAWCRCCRSHPGALSGALGVPERRQGASEAQTGGTTHAASAAPARIPSENTAMATAIRTAQPNILNLASSSAVTEFSPPPPGGSKQYIVAAVRRPPTLLRLRSPPSQFAC